MKVGGGFDRKTGKTAVDELETNLLAVAVQGRGKAAAERLGKMRE